MPVPMVSITALWRPSAAPKAASAISAIVASFSITTGRPVAASTVGEEIEPGKVDEPARDGAARFGVDLAGDADADGASPPACAPRR